MTTNLDDRLHVLMARLGDATPVAPEFESLASRSVAVVATPSRPARRWAPLVAAAAACALVVGVIAVREHDTTSAVPPSTKQVATDLPDGWSLVKAVGPGTLTFEGMPPGRTNLYATEAAPLGPVVGVSSEPMRGGERVDATNTTLPDGRRVILSDDPTGMRWADVEVASGTWITMQSRDLDDATILQLAASISADGDQLPTFSAVVAAAVGLALAGATETYLQQFWYDADGEATSMSAGTTVTRYAPADGSVAIDVRTFVPTALTRAGLGLWTDATATDGGVIGPLPRQDGATGFYAERDGFAFYATGPATMIDEIRALVASLAPVSDVEWQRLVNDGALRPADTTVPVNDTVVVTTAARPRPATSTVELTAAVNPGEAAAEYTVVLTAPDGTTTTFTVTYLGRTITVESDPAVGEVLSSDVDVAPRSNGASVLITGSLAFVVAHEPATSSAVRMSVTVDGVRYLVDLVQPDTTYPVKLGLLLVSGPSPTLSGIEPVLLDATGNPIGGPTP